MSAATLPLRYLGRLFPVHDREKETLILVIITCSLVFAAFAVGGTFLKGGATFGLMSSLSVYFLIPWIPKTKRETIFNFVAKYLGWIDLIFTVWAFFAALTLGVTIGVGLVFFGFIQTSILRIMLAIKDPQHRLVY